MIFRISGPSMCFTCGKYWNDIDPSDFDMHVNSHFSRSEYPTKLDIKIYKISFKIKYAYYKVLEFFKHK